MTTMHEVRSAIEKRAWEAAKVRAGGGDGATSSALAGREYGSALAEELDRVGPAERTLYRAAVLQVRAHQGSYAAWVTVGARVTQRSGGAITLRRNSFTRLGKARLEKLFPEQVRANLAASVGGPCYVVVSSKQGIPCLYLRARYGGDFRELGKLVASTVKAYDPWASVSVIGATKPARALIEGGL